MDGRRRRVLQVTGVRTILVTAPWKGDPFWAPDEEFWRTAALIEVSTDEGVTGLGETVMGYFAGEVVPPIVDYYARLLCDPANRLDPTQPDRCFDELYQRSLWWGRVGLALSVLSGIEMALWDIAGKAAGKPVHALLGGAAHDRLPLYASGGTGGWPVQKTVDQAKRYVDLGFRGLKLGTGMNDRPGSYETARTPAPYGLWYGGTTAARIDDEREKFRAMRDAVGPDIELATDSHAVQIRGPWGRRDALAVAQAIEEFDLLFYEEPLRYDDPDGYAEIRRQTRIPIAGGECLTGVGEFADWFRRGALDVAQPDATHVGGIGPCLAVAKEAAANHAALIVHTGAAIGPGLMANLHVAFASPNARFVECALAPDNVRAEMLAEPVRVTDGFATLPTAPGLGVELRPDFIDKYPFKPGIVEYA
jgi:L-alanine-DL-glutamate epimerase-like enolase superfamily enzyme